MASPTLQKPVGRVADLAHRELILLQDHGVTADVDPAFSTVTQSIVELFCRATGFSGMQIKLLRWELLFAEFGRDWQNTRERYAWQRLADEELLDDLNSPGAALRIVPLRRWERLL